MIKKLSLLLSLIFLFAFNVLAQNQQPEMANAMRSNGKIYVVVVICLVILFGLIGYVWRVDRRVSKLEQQKKD